MLFIFSPMLSMKIDRLGLRMALVLWLIGYTAAHPLSCLSSLLANQVFEFEVGAVCTLLKAQDHSCRTILK